MVERRIGIKDCEKKYTFFFQAEDGIRDWSVTGVQTCALPIWLLLGSPIMIGEGQRQCFAATNDTSMLFSQFMQPSSHKLVLSVCTVSQCFFGLHQIGLVFFILRPLWLPLLYCKIVLLQVAKLYAALETVTL